MDARITMTEPDWDQIWDDMDAGSEPDPLISEYAARGGGRAIDLGCGLGENTIALAAAGWEAIGVDTSAAAVRRARETTRVRGVDATFSVADLTEGVPGAGYDLITMFYLHLEPDDHAALLADVSRALAPGGTFLNVGHAKDFIDDHEGNMGELVAAGHDHGHAHGEDEPDWEELWAEREIGGPERIASLLTGLRVERAETITREVRHGPQMINATDVVVVAVKP